jgi:hypothetical protein
MRLRELYTTVIFEGPADVVKSLRATYPEPNQIDYINKNYEWIKNTFPKGAEWYMLLVGALMSGDQAKLQKRLGQLNLVTSLDGLQHNLLHFSTLDYQPIKDYAFNNKPVSDVLKELAALEEKWKRLPNRPLHAQQGDYIIKDYGNGFQWWFIDRGYCSEEGRSGKHCGNANGQTNTDERILSFRKDMKVVFTFILLPDGHLGEMKANGNQKPDPKFHTPYIMDILLDNRVTGITGAGWGPEFNFSIFDLDETNFNIIMKQRPTFISDQIVATPREMLKAPDIIRSNPEYQQIAIQQDPTLGYFFVNGKFDNSHQAWERAIRRQNPKYIVYAPSDLENYRERLINTLSITSKLFLECPRNVIKDVELVKAVLTKSPWAIADLPASSITPELCKFVTNLSGFKYIPDEKQTPELCKLGVAQNGMDLNSVSEELMTPELCKIAVSQNPHAYNQIPVEFRTPEMYKFAANHGANAALKFLPTELLTPELYTNMVKHNGLTLDEVPEELMTPELCKLAVSHTGYALRAVPENLRTPELCKIAVLQDGIALYAVPENLRTPELCKLAVSDDGTALEYVPNELMTPELCKLAVSDDGTALEYVPNELMTPELFKLAVERNPHIAVYHSNSQYVTPEILLFAIKTDPVLLVEVDAADLEPGEYYNLCKASLENFETGKHTYQTGEEDTMTSEVLELTPYAFINEMVNASALTDEQMQELRRLADTVAL